MPHHSWQNDRAMHRNLIAAVLLLLASGCSSAEEEPAPEGPGPAVPALPAAPEPEVRDGAALRVYVEGVPELSGRYWRGDLVLLPPGHRVTLRSLGAGGAAPALGDADLREWQGTWEKAGGSSTPLKRGGLSLFTPQLPGARYSLSVDPHDGEAGEAIDAEPARFPVAILHEAEIARSSRTGRWRVTVARQAIGTYPNPEKATSWRVRMHKGLYRPPRFWMKLSPDVEKLHLSPSVLTGQMIGFITDKKKTRPKRRHTSWFPPNRPFVYELEMLTRELRKGGLRFKRLAVNSCFRTPYYNRRIGGSSFSRHIYGDAADVMIDEDGDEVCDDINGDGRVDELDGLVIGQAARRVANPPLVPEGGIGVYGFIGKDSCRSYCHFDGRGYITRWGAHYPRGRRRVYEWWPADEYREDQEPPPEFAKPPADGEGQSRE
jgi:hypothetical protein